MITKKQQLLSFFVCVLLLALTAVIFRFQFQTTLVVGRSMQPGYRTGDLLLVNKLAYSDTAPERGDLVVARHRSDYLFKRVVGLPGEIVEIREGRLRLQDQWLDEPYPLVPGYLAIGRGRLGDGRYALVGDNRSMDSWESVHGVFGVEDLVGQVVFSIPTGTVLTWSQGLSCWFNQFVLSLWGAGPQSTP